MSQIWKKSRANKHTQNESTAPKTKKSFFHLNDYRTYLCEGCKTWWWLTCGLWRGRRFDRLVEVGDVHLCPKFNHKLDEYLKI